jgi:uncharacterized protein YigE (DUF2233 family)
VCKSPKNVGQFVFNTVRLTIAHCLLFIVSWLLLTGCTTSIAPTAAPIPTAPSPTPTTEPQPSPIAPDGGWQLRQAGVEERTITLVDVDGDKKLYIVRLDPALVTFRVGYHAGAAQSLEAWLDESGAILAVNGGYFDEANVATGLVVSDGVATGISHGTFAGMFAVTTASTYVEWLANAPYFDDSDPYLYGEQIEQAVQSFPLLVKPGGVMGYPDEDGKVARRTVVGQDANGRFLFILAVNGRFTLHQLSQWLVASDLELDIGLNLDGGTSTGLRFADGSGVAAFSLLPVVILVHEKGSGGGD